MIQAADRGTHFLDEIGDPLPTLQSKILRVLETRGDQPLGAEPQCRSPVGPFPQCPSASRNFSASIAAMQPAPAAVIAWRYVRSCTSPAWNTPAILVRAPPADRM